MSFVKLFYLVYSCVTITDAARSVNEKMFIKVNNLTLDNNATYATLNAPSKVMCAYLCGSEKMCRSLSYHGESGVCKLSKYLPTANVMEEQGWSIFVENPMPMDCLEIQEDSGYTSASGVYSILLPLSRGTMNVYCDMDTNGGGWTVFQRRYDGSTDFYRTFTEYENGFGQVTEEFWLGLGYVYELTVNTTSELRIDLEAADNSQAHETFSSFSVSASPTYALNIGEQTGLSGFNLSVIGQWVESVTDFSSEYGGNWAAARVVGEADVYPDYGDISGAWTPNVYDGNQYIEVHFNTPVNVKNISIYETFNAGRVTSIEAWNSDDTLWEKLYNVTTVTTITQSRIFSPTLKTTNFNTQDIRININCFNVAGKYCEIDAIMLYGTTANGLQLNAGAAFVTPDHVSQQSTCAVSNHGAWWYNSCTDVNLNGDYVIPGTQSNYNSGNGGVIHKSFKGVESLKETKMMFRRN